MRNGYQSRAAIPAAAVLLGLASGALAGEGLVGAELERATADALVGEWFAQAGKEEVRLTIERGGRFELGDREGSCVVAGETLKLVSGGTEKVYAFKLDEKGLALSGGDLPRELRFVRQTGLAGVLGWLLDATSESARRKAWRLALIAVVALAAREVIRLLRVASRVVVISDRGPLRYFYRKRKNRALTMNSVVLNVVKYVVYLVALGAFLSELGVNYVAYVASLSVVGLAIGFGAQGLVKDVVTGVFILLEEQFDVGDMVELSGQTGIVEELGLRTTRIRNHQEQIVMIPNGNVAVVANYARGGLEVAVDVAVEPGALAAAAEVVRRAAEEVAGQFGDVVLAPPAVEPPGEKAAERNFVRVAVMIWPGQQWVIDGQLVPRIREAMKREEIAIASDRVVVSHRSDRSEAGVARFWRKHLRKLMARLGRRGESDAPTDAR